MHEFSIATGIVESVLEFTEGRDLAKVLSVRLLVGELTCIASEQLKFCYESIVQETRLAGSTLELENVTAEVRCGHCSYHGAPRYWDNQMGSVVPTLQCPACGRATEATRGHECAIKNIQILQPEVVAV